MRPVASLDAWGRAPGIVAPARRPCQTPAVGYARTIDANGGKVVVFALPHEGEALPGAPALGEIDQALEAGATAVVVDTSAREVVTSAAIGFVIMVRQHLAPEVKLALLGGRQLERLVEMMNLSGVLPTFATLEDATGHLIA